MGELIENSKREAIKKIAKANRVDIFEIISDEIFNNIPCYYDKNKNIFLYNKEEKKWILGDQTDLINIAKFIVGEDKCNDSKFRSSLLNSIMDKARWRKPQEVPTEWIQFEDNFYDIQKDEIIKIDNKYFNQIKIPHKIGKSYETPIIDKHIISWVGKNQYKLFVQICAYCMLKSYPFARFFIFYGTGQDGKSTAGDFITRLIGLDNTCNVDIDQLSQNRFEAQKLYQKTLAVCGEVDYKLLKNTRKLKGVTGNDPMTIEFKNKNPFEYRNFAKLLWYANGIPPTYDKTQGFYRRTIILKFPNKFKECVDPLGNIPEEEYEKFCLKCTKYLKDLLINGFDEKSLEEKTKQYEELSNPVHNFCKECLVQTSIDSNFILMSDLYKEYCVYASKKSYRNINYRDFVAMIKSEVDIENRNVYEDSEGKYYLNKPAILNENTRRIKRDVLVDYKIEYLSSDEYQDSSQIPYVEKVNENKVLTDTQILTKRNPIHDIILECLKLYDNADISVLMKYTESEHPHQVMPHIEYLCKNGDIHESSVGVWRLK